MKHHTRSYLRALAATSTVLLGLNPAAQAVTTITTLTTTTGTVTQSAVIADVAPDTTAVVKTGAGTNVLNMDNTYTGGTTVDKGTINVSGNQSAANGGWNLRGFGDSGTTANSVATTVNFNTGSTIAVASGKNITVGFAGGGFNLQTLNALGTVTNAGTLSVLRSGRLNVKSGAAWNQTGAMSISGTGGGGSAATIESGGTFTYANASKTTIKMTPGAQGGASVLTIDGTGRFTTNAGFQNNAAFGATNGETVVTLSNGGTLQLAASVGALTTQVGLTLGTGGGTIDTGAFNTTLAATVTGSGTGGTGNVANQRTGIIGIGGLTKLGTGTLTLAGTNTYTGKTTVSAGTLTLASTGSLASSTIEVASGATFDAGTAVMTKTFNLAEGAVVTGQFTSTGTTTVTADLGNGFSQIASVFGFVKADSLNLLLSNVADGNYGSIFTGGFSGSFTSVSIAGTALNNNSGVFTGTVNGFDYTFTDATNNLTIASAIPEPSTYAALAGLGVLALALSRRRGSNGV